MATEGEKSGRESGKTKGETGNASRTPATRSGSSSAEGECASKGKAGVSEYQKTRQRELEAVLAKRTEANPDAPAIVREFAMLWLPHHLVEAEMLAPALQDAGVDEDKMAAVKVRKDILNLLLADLIQTAEVEFAEAKLEALSDAFDAVVRASDREGEELTEPMESGEGMSALGSQMKARYARVKERFANFDQTIGEAMDMLAPRSLSVSSTRRQSRRENSMARYPNTPDRDEQGRFLPEHDREYSRGGYRGGQERDESGRFMSEGGRRSRSRYEDEDEGNGGGRRSMGRGRDDDDERYSGRGEGRGHGGWFGDSEGHSEASRRGWQRSDHGESGWFGDREGHSDASRRGWQRSDHGESGWFGDPEGHSEASRRGWRRSDHGESGWYGDREGHSEASRRGWEGGHRSQRRDDDEGSYRSRSRYEDDDRRGGRYEDDRGSRSRSHTGHGGWSGDPEGHSEASRRGWENRRR